MTAPVLLPASVPHRDLIIDPEDLGSGGQSSAVVRCLVHDRRYVYKEYRQAVLAELDQAALARSVAWWRALPAAQRPYLSRLAWPQAVVLGGDGQARGILMAPAHDGMYERLRFQHGDRIWPRHLDVLAMNRQTAQLPARRVATAYCEPPVKLVILAHLLETMVWLHDHGFAVGDLHLLNAMFDPDQRAVLILDCDAAVSAGWGSALPWAELPLYATPFSHTRAFSVLSDYAKFSQVVVRCLLDSPEESDIRPPDLRSMVNTSTVDLLRKTWYGELTAYQLRSNWQPRIRLWRSLIRQGKLFVQIDGYTTKPWPNGAATARPRQPAASPTARTSPGHATATGRTPLITPVDPRPAAPAPGPRLRRSALRRAWSVVAAAAALASITFACIYFIR